MEMDEKEKYIFFWSHQEKNEGEVTKKCLSQWYNCMFEIDGIKYYTAEQYMMSQKALAFNDKETYSKIMEEKEPREYKKLGRQVKNFDSTIWDKKKFEAVIKGNIAKFSQNEKLKEFLLNTQEKILVEASPYDKIWGIGMDENDKDILDPSKWKGENLLGKALMKVREIIKKENLPKIIIMMVSSFDGQAKGKYLFEQGSPKEGLIEFFKEFKAVPHEADIYGANTMKEAYCPGKVNLSKYLNNNIIIPKEDWISANKLDYYVFTFDRNGDINYTNCNFDAFAWMKCPEKIGVCESHAVEILLESVTNEYLQFLREKKVSYIFAGKEKFDYELALQKMKKIFKVNSAILGGGPTINGIFYDKNLVNEVNIVLFPCSGSGDDNIGILGKGKFVEFDLFDLKKFDGGSVLLKYRKK